MNWLDSVPVNLLNKDLDGLWQRQQAISDNIANVETPGYKSKTVSFEDQLQEQLETPAETTSDTVNRIKSTGTATSVSTEESSRLDGNNVDVEKENTELARTQINYLYSLRELSDYFSRLKYAITEGKS
ncbi:MAG: flagellar basal body rod protein FlgB [Clostridiales bacterium]|jgi:flagellar basal-body rod protein FlgB|nr:flagellar basal body rod protein FlgB [Clostridiales bacterium]